MVIGAGLFDMVDGRVARATNQVTRFGGFFDSVLDRYSDLALFMGLLVYYASINRFFYIVLTAIVMTGSVMVSYTRARAENAIPKCKVGFLERPERVVLIIIGALFDRMARGAVGDRGAVERDRGPPHDLHLAARPSGWRTRSCGRSKSRSSNRFARLWHPSTCEALLRDGAGALAIAYLVSIRPALMLALVAAGRSPVCPLKNALKSRAHIEEPGVVKDRILSGQPPGQRGSGTGAVGHPERARSGFPRATASCCRSISPRWSGTFMARASTSSIPATSCSTAARATAISPGKRCGREPPKSSRSRSRPASVECIRRNLAAEIAAGRVVVYPKASGTMTTR